jgi:hypothetical protein
VPLAPKPLLPPNADLPDILREQLDYLIEINSEPASKADEARLFRVMALLLEPFKLVAH